jgi:hypothetical protein
VLEPGTLKPVMEVVVVAGAITSTSALLVTGVPGGVVIATGGATSGVAAQKREQHSAHM